MGGERIWSPYGRQNLGQDPHSSEARMAEVRVSLSRHSRKQRCSVLRVSMFSLRLWARSPAGRGVGVGGEAGRGVGLVLGGARVGG